MGNVFIALAMLTHLVELYGRSHRLRKEEGCLDYWDTEQRNGYLAAQTQVETQLRAEGVIPLCEFNAALFEYLNMPVEQVLTSDQMIVRALGMFDKRPGKRRLASMDVSEKPELAQSIHLIRSAFEGLRVKQNAKLER